MSSLVLTIRFHDGRYHGLQQGKRPEWPPSPARLFQALVAGAARGNALDPNDCDALTWLEALSPPIIAAPPARRGRAYDNFVPNNDIDAMGGDIARVAEIRAAKRIQPMLFDEGACLLYCFRYDGDRVQADRIVSIAGQLYQLGRGVDMAWAQGEVLLDDEAERRLADWRGAVHRPHAGSSGDLMDCPVRGTLESLVERHRESGIRFRGQGKSITFAQPRKARFRRISYDARSTRLLYDLRDTGDTSSLRSWAQRDVVHLVTILRDGAVARLTEALPSETRLIERVFVGRNATDADKGQRIRILPLPSIGHEHADHCVRRLLVEILPDCPLSVGDIDWAFSGLTFEQVILAPAAARAMLTHYGLEDSSLRRWRTVTPAVLQIPRVHGRNSGTELSDNRARVAQAVKQALRHAGVRARTETIRVQREPFAAKGARSDGFAAGTRFDPRKLWHMEIAFRDTVEAPLVLGDGRYLGLGLMAPVRESRSIFRFNVSAPITAREASDVAGAFRRAIMARVRDTMHVGSSAGLPRFFCGHEANGDPSSDSSHGHLHIAAIPRDPGMLLVVAPHRISHRIVTRQETEHIVTLEASLQGLKRLVVARNQVLDVMTLHDQPVDDPLIGPSQGWESITPYAPTRHAGRGRKFNLILPTDVRAECRRVGLPEPDVEVIDVRCGPNGGNPKAHLRMRFGVAVDGPIMIGRLSHQGGGLFVATDERRYAADARGES